MRKLVVHEALALALHALRNFGVHEAEQFRLVAFELPALGVVPPVEICCVALFRVVVEGLHSESCSDMYFCRARLLSRPLSTNILHLPFQRPSIGISMCRMLFLSLHSS